MPENVEMVNRAATASPYIKTNQQAKNTKELFDLLRPDRMGQPAGDADKQKGVEKSAQQLIERIKQHLVSKESDMVSAGLRKLLDTAVFLNNKSGAPVLNDKELQQMMLKPEMLLKELTGQQKGASIFKGEFFDNLRNLLSQMKSSAPLQQEAIKDAVVNVLRQYANSYVKAQSPADGKTKSGTVENSSQTQTQTQTVAGKSDAPPPAAAGRVQTAVTANFGKALDLLQRDMSALTETLKEGGEKFDALRAKIENVRPDLPQMLLNQVTESRQLQQNSSVDKILDFILSKLDENIGSETPVRLYGEQIVRGLLNTNTISQPILHFVLPVLFENMGIFAEMWVDPDANNPYREDGKGKNSQEKSTRVFLTVDLEDKGKAEIDIILTNGKLYTGLYYPPQIAEAFAAAEKFIGNVTREAGFSVGLIHVQPLEASRALDEAVGKPLERRMALDTKA